MRHEAIGAASELMHLEAHVRRGWSIGHLPEATPQMRRGCVLGAMLPDLDYLGYVGVNLSCVECGRPLCVRYNSAGRKAQRTASDWLT